MIILDNISKHFGEPDRKRGFVSALESVSLTVHKVSSVSIVGPSGCGKSTLIRLVSVWKANQRQDRVRRQRSEVSRSRTWEWRFNIDAYRGAPLGECADPIRAHGNQEADPSAEGQANHQNGWARRLENHYPNSCPGVCSSAWAFCRVLANISSADPRRACCGP